MRGMFAESMTIGDAIAWGTSLLDESDCHPCRAQSFGCDSAVAIMYWQFHTQKCMPIASGH